MAKPLILRSNSNGKLGCDSFSVIKPANREWRVGDIVTVKLAVGKGDEMDMLEIGRFTVTSCEEFALHELTEERSRLAFGISAKSARELLRAKHTEDNIFQCTVFSKQDDSPKSAIPSNAANGGSPSTNSEAQPKAGVKTLQVASSGGVS